MNIHLKSAIFQILPTSAIPLLVAATSYILQSIAVSIMYFLDPLDKLGPQYLNHQEMDHYNLHSHTFPLLQHITKVSMSIYDNYFYFMAAMTLLHAMIRILTLVVKSVTIVSKQLYSPTEQSQEYPTDNNIKTWKSHIALSEATAHSPVLQAKRMHESILEIMIGYSLMYYLCLVAYSIMHYVIYSHIGILDSQKGLPMLQQNDIIQLQGISPINIVDRKKEYSSERNLNQQDSSDIIYVLSSLSIDEDLYLIYPLDETQLWLLCSDKIIPVNLTDPMSPKLLSPIDISIDGPNFLLQLYISSNGKTLIRSYFDSVFYITQLSDPHKYIKLSHKPFINFQGYPFLALSLDGEGGYIATDNLYQFNTSSGDAVEISSFQKMKIMSFVLAADGRTAFIVLSKTGLNVDSDGILRILDVTTSTVGDTPFAFLLGFATNSIVVSSDSNTLFLVNADKIEVLNVTNKTSPNIISSFAPEGIDDDSRLILSPDDNTLIIRGKQFSVSYIVDVSNLMNPIVLPSTFFSGLGFPQFSVDSKFIFMPNNNGFQVASAPVNLKLGNQLPFTPVNITTNSISLNCTIATSVTVSHDGTKAFIVCDQGIIIYLISDRMNFTYYGAIETNASASRIILSADEDIIFFFFFFFFILHRTWFNKRVRHHRGVYTLYIFILLIFYTFKFIYILSYFCFI